MHFALCIQHSLFNICFKQMRLPIAAAMHATVIVILLLLTFPA
jgi:hypothetical protein